jgi:hypothetical protein
MSELSCPVSASDTRLTTTHLPSFLTPLQSVNRIKELTGRQLFYGCVHAACVHGSSAAASSHNGHLMPKAKTRPPDVSLAVLQMP